MVNSHGDERDVTWLGLTWARKERQSERLAHYDEGRDRLIAAGRLYSCYETPEELIGRAKAAARLTGTSA